MAVFSGFFQAFNRLFKHVDEYNAPWWQVIGVLFACVFARSVFEGLLEKPQQGWLIERVVVVSPFYFALLFAIVLLLVWLSREQFSTILKKSVFLFPIIIAGPFFDFVFTFGGGAVVKYFRDPALFFSNLVGFGLTDGATPGIRLEILLMCFFVAAYLFYKRRNAVLSFFSFVATYLVVMLFGYIAAPFFVARQTISDSSLAIIFVPLALALAFLGLYLENKRAARLIASNFRFLQTMHYFLAVLAGIAIALHLGAVVEPKFFARTFLSGVGAILAIVLSFYAQVWLNDITDRKGDLFKSDKRPLFKGMLPKSAFLISMFFLVSALTLGFAVGEKVLVLVIGCNSLGFLYSFGPNFKRIPIFSSFVLSLIMLLAMLAGFLALKPAAGFAGFPLSIALTVVVAFTLSAGIKDIKDAKGDSAAGVCSLPVILGEKKGRIATAVMLFLGFLSVPLLMQMPVLWPFALILGGFGFFFVLARQDPEPWVYSTYFVFFAVIAWFYNFG